MRGSHGFRVRKGARGRVAAAVVGAAVVLPVLAPSVSQAAPRGAVPARAGAHAAAPAPKRATTPSGARPVRVIFGHKLG
jgi:hypothetical protein